jgi:hypothetical protein
MTKLLTDSIYSSDGQDAGATGGKADPSYVRQYIAPLLRIDSAGVQVSKLSHHHLALMDYMLANPTLPQWAVAQHFKRTQAWISTVINSDLFQAHMHERRRLIEDGQRESMNAKLFAMSSRGLDKMMSALDDDETSVAEKRAITRMGLDAQGYMANGKGQSPTVNINNSVTAQALSASDENKDRIQAARDRILNQSRNAQLLLSQPATGQED